MLGASQTSMDGTIKTGKVLMDKSPEDDAITIEGKIADLKARWDAICALSVERYVTRILTFFCFLFIDTLLLRNVETLIGKVTIFSTCSFLNFCDFRHYKTLF